MLSGSLTFDVSMPSVRSVGAIAQYACEIGYQLTSGSTQRICLPTLDWEGHEPISTKKCSDTFYRVCFNCGVLDGVCPFVTTPSTFDECRSSAISENSTFVEYDATSCKTFSCQFSQLEYRNGSVAIFPSCNTGFIIVYKGIISIIIIIRNI